jgi:hypothetical protein
MKLPCTISELPTTAITVFQSEMESRNVNLDDYDVLLFESDSAYIVVTRYKQKPPRLRGSVEGFPEYEVRIACDTYKVLDVSFVR